MGKKLIGIIILGLLISSFGPVCSSNTFSMTIQTQHSTSETQEWISVVKTQEPSFSEKDGFLEVQLMGATTLLLAPNKPVLPISVNTLQIPYQSTQIEVDCMPQTITSAPLEKDIIPARIGPLSTLNEHTEYVKDPIIYGSDALYPSTWYTYELGAGRNENDQQVTFVKIICYPIRYSPVKKELLFTSGFDIKVTYHEPTRPLQTEDDTYDLVIIAPAKFESALQKLIDHKNSKGMMTMFKSVEDILDEYDGYDQPEQIKYFIKDAYDTMDITYVLLVGGLKNHILAKDKDTRSAGWKAWWVPVRYVNIPHVDDEGCLSDLYYGCLYNATGAFDSWDSNGDGVYAAWNAPGVPKDSFDLYPEVYVGRLPIANSIELNHMIRKIITYESSGPEDKPWYTTFIGIGGKTGTYYAGQPDGEYLCDLAYDYVKTAIPDLHQVKIYSTNRDSGGPVPDLNGISTAFSEGAGFVDFQGHGSPSTWDTIWFDGEYPDDWIGGLQLQNFWRIRNGAKQPIMVVGGCHNAMYNISMLPAMKDKTGENYFSYGYPVPICFCWGLMVKPTGGAIASTGSTGYGIGYTGDPLSLSGALEANFFYEIGNGSTHIAQAHSHSIRKFLVEESLEQTAAFVITNWALLGDPSLMLGGYSS
jgi:hypothetical protein